MSTVSGELQNEKDDPSTKFSKFVGAVKGSLEIDSDHVDLDKLCDSYLRTIWDLSVSVPLKYIDGHPFDLSPIGGFSFYELENKTRGQAKSLELESKQSPRSARCFSTPDGSPDSPFTVIVDGIELARPILFHDLPTTKTAVKTPLVFVGKDNQQFSGKPVELSGGPLVFEAYLFWSPKIIPKQHRGVVLRVGNASGALFDSTFMNYQVSEQTRLRQITAEIFVSEGLDGAINLDRESFNYAHPHYQYLVKWLHSALRQLVNKHKAIGKEKRSAKVASEGDTVRAEMDEKVDQSLRSRGIEDVPDVVLLEKDREGEARDLRSKGSIVLHKEKVIPPLEGRKTEVQTQRQKNAETKASAIAQVLHGWGLMDDLSYEDQEKLVHDILDIVMLDS